jgi:phosphoadenosine phosphosulfate reductase
MKVEIENKTTVLLQLSEALKLCKKRQRKAAWIFQLLAKGGGAERRQRRNKALCRAMLPHHINNGNPTVDWTDENVWAFLTHYGCKSNPLYQCGDSRIGCIGCPMQGGNGMKTDFVRYPKYRQNYVKAFDRMLQARYEAGLGNHVGWENGETVTRWWVGDNPRQITLFDGE